MNDELIKEKLEILKISMYEELNRLKAGILEEELCNSKSTGNDQQAYINGLKLKKHKKSIKYLRNMIRLRQYKYL